MNKFYIILLLLAITSSCKTTKINSETINSVVFTYRKTECRGKCPVYYMEIFKNGEVAFDGSKNTDKIGKYINQIEKKDVILLISEFEKANFFAFKNEYTSLITDLPTTYIGFSNGDSTKIIRDYHDSPQELKRLELLLEDIVNRDGWKKMNK